MYLYVIMSAGAHKYQEMAPDHYFGAEQPGKQTSGLLQQRHP